MHEATKTTAKALTTVIKRYRRGRFSHLEFEILLSLASNGELTTAGMANVLGIASGANMNRPSFDRLIEDGYVIRNDVSHTSQKRFVYSLSLKGELLIEEIIMGRVME